jgi:HlyD family secretion protein
MDRTIEKKAWSIRRWAALAAAVFAVVVVGWQLASRASTTRLSVDPGRMTTARVRQGEFLEYYPFDSTVVPATSVYLDVQSGGRVEEIFADGGQHVNKGDLIVRFSNTSLQQTTIETETRVLENLDQERNTQFNRAESGLLLRETLLELDHQILDATNKMQRYDAMLKSGDVIPISKEDYETKRNELAYLKGKRALMAERIRQEDTLSEQQVAQAQKSIERLNQSLDLLGRIVQSLEVRAPISGYLSTIDAEVGQNVTAGQRIGQIDLLDKFKLRAKIDQFYISRVAVGTPGHVDLDGHNWGVRVQKIYPEVKDSAFQADVVFAGDAPSSLKRGQTLTVELTFGSPSQSLMVSKGGFYQQTSGRWVYLISKDGRRAHKTEVRLGRQNPREVEVIDGLRAGDRIITSSYDTFNGVDELKFTDNINPERDKT